MVVILGGEAMTTAHATAEVFFTAFKSLTSKEKEAFLEKVMGDTEMRHDIIDIALIEEAKKAKGKAIDAKDYFKRRKTDLNR
jgi:hypothetical protein